MRQPECLAPLVDQGIIQQVVRPLMSGKEAQIYLVVSDGELRVAKVYKEAQNRTFRQRIAYTEGRAVRNSRTARAMSKRSRYGRAQDEESWRSAEVDIIYRLRAAGVRVPEPYHFSDGVLVMELITDADGEPAPRLAEADLDPAEAGAVFETLLAEVVKMLCAGVVHGDLSGFNVLMGQDGPVLIDFPQAVDAAHNQSARRLLVRDVDNLLGFYTRLVPGQRRLPYGQELWDLYARSELSPETRLTGRYRSSQKKADTEAMLHEIEDVAREAQRQRERQGQGPRRSGRRGRKPQGTAPAPIVVTVKPKRPAAAAPAPAPAPAPAAAAKATRPGRSPASTPAAGQPSSPAPSASSRRRRRRRSAGARRASE